MKELTNWLRARTEEGATVVALTPRRDGRRASPGSEEDETKHGTAATLAKAVGEIDEHEDE